MQQAAHLDKICLHHSCFQNNCRTAIFQNISVQLFQVFRQTNFRMLLEDTVPFLQYLLFNFVQVSTFPSAFVESVTLTFKLHLIFDIPDIKDKPFCENC